MVMSEAIKKFAYKGLELWNQVFKSRLSHTKEVKQGGRKFTTVEAYSQIERATELWGPYGDKWGIENESFTFLRNDTMCLYKAVFYYPGGRFPINSSIEVVGTKGNLSGRVDGEFSKKVSTDALTKGLSKLGFNGDIFMGKFDDNIYVQQLRAEEEQHNYIQGLKNQYSHVIGELRGLMAKESPELITFIRQINKPVWNDIWNYILSMDEKRYLTELRKAAKNARNQ